MIVNIFIQRCCCLFNKEDISSNRNSYLNIVHPEAILEKQRVIKDLHHSVFILSAFPELLLYYSNEKFWNAIIDHHLIVKDIEKCCKDKLYQVTN